MLTNALHLSKTDQKSFVISFLDPYRFEMDDSAQVKLVLEAWQQLKLGPVIYDDAFIKQQADDEGKLIQPEKVEKVDFKP